MESTAKGKYMHCSARKVRAVANLIRNHSVESALALLFALKKTKKSAHILDKIVKSAVANLKEKNPDKQVEASSLKIKSICIDAGPFLKRIRARAQGRAFRINRKLCHITVAVSDQ